ncbi:MAG: site-specific integrase [Oligoflexales bacterium]|nr:site-specific integrase [Oligoflexales bacterium]
MSVTVVTRKKKNGKKVTKYRAEVYIDGARVESKIFETKGSAIIWHDQTKARWLSGHPCAGQIPINEATFNDVVIKYKSERLPQLKLSSQQSMVARFGHFEKSPLMQVSMKDFRANTIDSWLEWLKKQPTVKNRNRDHFKAELKYLAVILNWWRDYYDETFNIPIVRRHYINCFYKPVPKRRPDYFIRPEELRNWLTYLRDNTPNPVYFRMAAFMVSTGVRLGEAAGLMWDRIDLNAKECRIDRTLSWDHSTKQPYLVDDVKSIESARILPLSDEIVQMLAELKRISNLRNPVFHKGNGCFLSDNSVRRNFNRAFKACNLPWTATHICRHTHATISLMANDGNLSVVQSILGHKDQSVTQQYAKVYSMPKREAINRTAQKLNLPSLNHAQNHAQNEAQL